MLRQRSFVRATRQDARGQRSSACLSFHEARCSGDSSASTAASYGSSVAARPGEQVEDRRGGEPRRDEALVHPVARDRVDQPGRVADEQRPLAGDARPRPPQRQPVAAQALERRRRRGRAPRKRAAGARGASGPSLCQPPTPTFAWSPFGKTQRVAARDVGELDHEPARVALAAGASGTGRCPRRRRRGRSLRRARRALRGDPVRAVGADDHVGRRPARREPTTRVPRLDLDLDALAHLHPALAGRVEQERVEPPALRHPDERLRGVGARPRRRSGSAARPRRSTPRRPASGRPGTGGRPAASCPPPHGLSRGKARLVDEQHRGALLGEPVGGRRAGRPAADDDRVEALHSGRLQCGALSRGCARAAKGNGL